MFIEPYAVMTIRNREPKCFGVRRYKAADIKSFKKTKTDLFLLGFDMSGDFEKYYRTPKKHT